MNSIVRTNALWDDFRCDELKLLDELLREVTTINRGSHCLERIARCIEIAERLHTTDLTDKRMSFSSFLHDLAIADRFGPMTSAQSSTGA